MMYKNANQKTSLTNDDFHQVLTNYFENLNSMNRKAKQKQRN